MPYASPLEQLALRLTARAACPTPHRWSSLPYASPLEQLTQYLLNVGPDNSLSTGPACHLTGMVTQGPHHRRHPEALARMLRSLLRHLTVYMYSLVPPARVWPCCGLEFTSISRIRMYEHNSITENLPNDFYKYTYIILSNQSGSYSS